MYLLKEAYEVAAACLMGTLQALTQFLSIALMPY